MTEALAVSAALLCLAMMGAWALQRRTGNSGWIDTIWSFAVGLAGLAVLALIEGAHERRALVAALLACWSLRLGLHILNRTGQSSDDPRYAALMAGWGADAPRRLFWFLQLQAGAGLVLVACIALAGASPAPAGAALTLLPALLALVAIAGEGIADAQLAACKRNPPPDRICRRGLWTRSRHPNYFFEWLFWVAMALLAVAPPAGWISILALAAPAMMYGLLRHASGVPHVEAHMLRTRPEAFRAYAADVPVFFPRLRR